MAGSYPDVPSRRMAWDADGTVMAHKDENGIITEFSATNKERAQSEDGTSEAPTLGATVDDRIVAIFPELREVDGYYISLHEPATFNDQAEVSTDTTNGIDGTWSALGSNFGSATTTHDEYRTAIHSLAGSNVRGFEFPDLTGAGGGGGNVSRLHIYGDITPGETPDRLLFIDEATGLEYTAARDYGDTPRGGSEDVTWRIKNNSASLTAETIQYTTEDLFRGSGAWYTHSLPGGSTYQATRQVASLAPATTSGLITTRRVTPGDALLGVHAGRTYLNVGTWS